MMRLWLPQLLLVLIFFFEERWRITEQIVIGFGSYEAPPLFAEALPVTFHTHHHHVTSILGTTVHLPCSLLRLQRGSHLITVEQSEGHKTIRVSVEDEDHVSVSCDCDAIREGPYISLLHRILSHSRSSGSSSSSSSSGGGGGGEEALLATEVAAMGDEMLSAAKVSSNSNMIAGEGEVGVSGEGEGVTALIDLSSVLNGFSDMLNSAAPGLSATAHKPQEIIDWVTDDGQLLCSVPRDLAHDLNLMHRGVGVLVRDHLGRIFIHQRAEGKRLYPNMFDMLIGGVSMAGEDALDTLQRELLEEIGVDLSSGERPDGTVVRLGEKRVVTPLNQCIVNCFVVSLTAADTPVFRDGEIQWGNFVSADEVRSMVLREREKFVPDGLQVWEYIEAFFANAAKAAAVQAENNAQQRSTQNGNPEYQVKLAV